MVGWGKSGFYLNVLHGRGLKNITVNMHPQVPGGGRGDLEKTEGKAKNSERKGVWGGGEGVGSTVKGGRIQSVSNM